MRPGMMIEHPGMLTLLLFLIVSWPELAMQSIPLALPRFTFSNVIGTVLQNKQHHKSPDHSA